MGQDQATCNAQQAARVSMPQTGRLAGLIATYDNDGSGVHFHLKDWLGTRRMQTNYAGTPEDAWTGLPFGNGLTQTYGTSTTALNRTIPAKNEIKRAALMTSGRATMRVQGDAS